MSDALLPWQIQYINLLKGGKSGTDAMQAVGCTLEEFSNARLNNASFNSALSLAEAGIGATTITAEELSKLREAQVSEARVAAYFGVTVDELRAALEKDEKLRRVYETGVGRGQAMIQVAQFEAAIAGDSTMLKHTGMHILDQKEKGGKEISLEDLDAIINLLRAQVDQDQVAKRIDYQSKIIEVEYKEDENTDSK